MDNDPTLVLRVALRYALASRTASRIVTAAYFNVNDRVLYGKWKNKRGVIKAFSTDPKGNPLVEIEPTPKGRKKNKIMGLFKFWHDPPPALRDGGARLAGTFEPDEDEDDD